MTRLHLNPALEVVPGDPDGLLLRLPLWNRALAATRLHAGLLRLFQDGKTVEEALAESPFGKDEARRFLQRARAQGFLLEEDDDGRPRLPDTVDPPVRFCAAPAFDESSPAGFVVVGVPWDRDTTGRPGARFGPAAIRGGAEGARFTLDPLSLQPAGFYDYASGETLLAGVHLQDAGDVTALPGEEPAAVRRRTARVVRGLVQRGAVPLVLGGDHAITRAVLQAWDEPLHVVHLDAHTDLGDVVPGAGLHHGNVMTVILEELPSVQGIHQIGLRGVVDRSGHVAHPKVRQLGMDALRRGGLADFLAGIPEGARCFVSIDVDVVDPAFAPSTGTPVPGGMLPHELKDALRAIARARDVVGADLVEVAEPAGPSDGTGPLAASCLLALAQGIVERIEENG